MKSVGHSCFKISFHHNLKRFGVPNDKLGHICLPIVASCHEVAVIFILTWVGAITLLVIDFSTSVTFAKAHGLHDFVLKLIKFDEACHVNVIHLFLCLSWSSFLLLWLYSHIAIPALMLIVFLVQ